MQRNNKGAHQLNSTGAKHHRGVIQVQPKAYQAKVVANGGSQGAADPRGWVTPYGHLPASPRSGGGMPPC